MQLQQFEQEILRLAFETESRITTASVAYYLGIPSREANRMLNLLLEEGVLELDSDLEGNLFYSLASRGEDIEAIKELKKADDDRGHAYDHAREVSSRVFGASVGESHEAPSSSPIVGAANLEGTTAIAHTRHSVPMHQPRPKPRETPKSRDNWGGFDDYYGPNHGTDMAMQPSRPAQTKPVWSGVVSRSASTDGSVGHSSSFGSPVLVSASARCEPMPLTENKPVLASCDEPVAGIREVEGGQFITSDDLWFGANRNDGALVPVSDETALARDYYIEQPEHQPGMALLLSLILCGTGQIYNGEVSKGIMMMVLCFLLWFVLLGWVVHIWSIVDAVVVAERLNRSTEVPT